MDKDLKACRVLETPEQEARRRAKGQIYPVSVCLHMHITMQSRALAWRIPFERTRSKCFAKKTSASAEGLTLADEQKCDIRSSFRGAQRRQEELSTEFKCSPCSSRARSCSFPCSGETFSSMHRIERVVFCNPRPCKPCLATCF